LTKNWVSDTYQNSCSVRPIFAMIFSSFQALNI